MGIEKFINKVYNVEELFGEVELAVAQLVDTNFSNDEEERPEALMRLLFIMSETDDEQRHFILMRAISYAFRHVPHYKRALEGYMRELVKGKGRKKKRKTPVVPPRRQA